MRWSPGPRSKNLEDRRDEWTNNPEGLLRAYQDAARQGTLTDIPSDFDLPPWMEPGPPSIEALATLRALKLLSGR